MGITFVALAGCNSEPAMVRQMQKERLISAIRQELLESAEEEKSAVLAMTDEESQAFAQESQRSAAEINRLRGELRPLIVADGRPLELEKLDAFDATWADLEKIDQRLLALAVANTNLKAARLSAQEGAAALDRFVTALVSLEGNTSDPETIRRFARASVGALRLQSLLYAHIPTADEAEMTRLEQRMSELTTEVDRSLESAAGQEPPAELAAAVQAWQDYQRVVADVVQLSRQNTDVISFDVSIHEKREAAKRCLAALAALLAAVESGPWPSR